MSGDACKIKTLTVDIQENGIIRGPDGHIIARLSDDIEFDSEHVQGKKMVDIEIDIDDNEFLYVAKMAHDRDITFNKMIEQILTQFMEAEDGKSNN